MISKKTLSASEITETGNGIKLLRIMASAEPLPTATWLGSIKKKIAAASKMGYSHFPVCIAKTQYSFSQDPKAYGAPSGFGFDIKDIVINSGSEMIVAIAGDIIRMPGLPKVPQATRIDIIDGQIEGLS